MFDGEDTVLVIGAHPDDEVLGAGGAIAKHSDHGDEVHILIITEGTTQQYDSDDIIDKKKRHAKNCAEQLGAAEVHFGGLPDMKLSDIPHVQVNAVIEEVCERVNPDIVYTHSGQEVNQDHVEVYNSTLVATRPLSKVKKVLSYETPSSTEWSPDCDGFCPSIYVEISSYMDTKVNAFKSYKTEIREYPHPRSEKGLRGLAQKRGMESGVKAAEAFDIHYGKY